MPKTGIGSRKSAMFGAFLNGLGSRRRRNSRRLGIIRLRNLPPGRLVRRRILALSRLRWSFRRPACPGQGTAGNATDDEKDE